MTRLHLVAFVLALTTIGSTVAWFLGVAGARPVVGVGALAMYGALGLGELRRTS